MHGNPRFHGNCCFQSDCLKTAKPEDDNDEDDDDVGDDDDDHDDDDDDDDGDIRKRPSSCDSENLKMFPLMLSLTTKETH